MQERRCSFHGCDSNPLKVNCLLHSLDYSLQFAFAFQCPSTNHKGSQCSMWVWILGVQCLHMGSSMWQYLESSQSTISRQYGQAHMEMQEQKILYIMRSYWINVYSVYIGALAMYIM